MENVIKIQIKYQQLLKVEGYKEDLNKRILIEDKEMINHKIIQVLMRILY